MKIGYIAIDRVVVPQAVQRPADPAADSRDLEHIRKHGIERPLVMVRDGKRILLAKGLRRLRFAKTLKLAKVPFILHPVPKGYKTEDYIRELRFALFQHREDPKPSVKCAMVLELKARFGMSNKEIAAYRGVDQDTITNWVALKNYIPEVVQAIDSDQLTMAAARVFDGMSEKGQAHVWKRHARDLVGTGKNGVHKRIRALYPPSDNPTLYRQPELVAQRLARKAGKRKGKVQAITTNEKRRLLSSVELREIELREGIEEEKRLKAQITAAIAPIAAIMRSDTLRLAIPPETREEFERFQEIY